jgi:predicted RNase H-like HicB family nuclease
MSVYFAILRREPGSCWGVEFPDVPGCFSAGDSPDEAIASAREALQGHLDALADHGMEIPSPAPAEDHYVRAGPDEQIMGALVEVEPPSRAVRVNVSLQERLLARIDRIAGRGGRSAFLARAAERLLAEEQRGERELERG